MIQPKKIFESITGRGSTFFAGVPDSLLKNLCVCVDDLLPASQHVIAANEGGAVAVATGNYLATGNVPVVYMQNSGIGNAVNPLLSLADSSVYSIPMLVLIGWRGEPGVQDEPQHGKQGSVTTKMLDAMDIPYSVLSDTEDQYDDILDVAYSYMSKKSAPYVILVKKNTFEKYNVENKDVQTEVKETMTREEVLSEVLDAFPDNVIYVGTTGKLSRELFELRESRSEGHEKDFLTVGSMGHASQIALGIAEQTKGKTVVCLDGDGAALMHLGGMATIGDRAPENLIHIIFNNGTHDSVGGQDVTGKKVDYVSLAKSVGYKNASSVSDKECLNKEIQKALGGKKPVLIECKIRMGTRSDLGRPTISPKDNKVDFTNYIR